MAKKKGKKGKKGKKSKKPVKEGYNDLTYAIPDYEDPDIVTPKVDLIIQIANPVNEVLQTKLEQVMISTRIECIIKQIKKLHQGAIQNIKVCRDRFNPEEAFDPNKTLQQCGILGDSNQVRLFYDYEPVTSPLLI